jgi:hypothetical protein
MVNIPVIHNRIGRDVTVTQHFVAQKPHAANDPQVADSVRRSHVALRHMLCSHA